MIPDQWYVILQSKEVPAHRPVGMTRMGEKMVAWRGADGHPVVQSDLCPHRGCALSIGKIKDDHIQCPFHGFEFDSTGTCKLIPANGKGAIPPKATHVKTYPVREKNGYIFIWWGEERAEYPALPEFDDLDASFTTSDDAQYWPVHYSRAIENQLDVFHLPFPHATTIGRGNRTVADGPIVRLNGDEMDIWVSNRVDNGTPAVRDSALPQPDRPPFLRFRFPQLWMNRISDDMRITVYFTPVDEENCVMYLRYYQRFVKVPLIRNLVSWLTKMFSIIIVNQDRRVVVTQRPLKTDMRIGERLIIADGPIITYRRRRSELQQAVGKEE